MSVLDHFIIKEIVMQQFDIPANSQETFKIIPADVNDKPGAKVFGKATFEIVPSGGALLLPADDGSSVTVQWIGEKDFQTISIHGDATATPGEKVVTTQFQVRTLAPPIGILDHFDISAGVIEPLP